jgi:hypothetical protein
MRRLWRFSPPNQEKDQDTDDDHQDAADEDQPVWHASPHFKKAGDTVRRGSNMNRYVTGAFRSLLRPYSTLNQHIGLVCDRSHLGERVSSGLAAEADCRATSSLVLNSERN